MSQKKTIEFTLTPPLPDPLHRIFFTKALIFKVFKTNYIDNQSSIYTFFFTVFGEKHLLFLVTNFYNNEKKI